MPHLFPDAGWRHTPIEFVDVPAGVDLPDALISLTLQGKVCPDCIPAGYSLRYSPTSVGMAHTDPRAWQVTVTHDPTCPGLWLLRRRAEGSG